MRKRFSKTQNYILVIISYAFLIISLALVISLESRNQSNIFNTQKNFARYINIAGKQRMISQRTALIVSTQKTQSSPNNKELEELINEFEANHQFLLTGVIIDTLRGFYFDEPTHLDKRVKNFIAGVKNYCDEKDNGFYRDQIITESTEILNYLNIATELFQKESENITQQIIKTKRRNSTSIYLFLFMMFFLIVIPTSYKIKKNDQALIDKTEALKKSLIQLSESEYLLTIALNKNGLTYWIFDLNNNTRKFSSVGYEILELDKDKEIPLDNWDKIIHPDDKEFVMNDFERIISMEITQYEHIHRIINKKGEYIWIKVYAASEVKDGKVSKIIGIFSDVTEDIKLKEQLIEAKESAIMANQAKSEFLANMSHEIRTPMNAILGFTETLYHAIDVEQHKRMLKLVLNNGNLLLSLLNDILDLSKIESGKIDILEYPSNLKYVVNEIKSLFQNKADKKNINLNIEIAESFPDIILLDEIRVKQILFNLVGNALKFTHSGSINILLRFKLTEGSRGDLEMEVADTGIGIPISQQELIFEAFRQQSGQSNRQYEGVGLGLAISKRLAEKMGGKISVESDIGKGATFKIRIPNLEINDAELHMPDEISDEIFSIKFFNETILVVDDKPVNIEIVTSLIGGHGLNFITAENGEVALEILNHTHPALILLDIRMPMIDGYEVAARIKANMELKHIPIIAFSASLLSDNKNEQNKNFDGFLFKPVKKAEVLSIISKFLKYKIEKSDVKEAQNKKSLKESIPGDVISRLPDILEELENEYLIEWNQIKNSFILYKIEEFANKLDKFAQNAKINYLKEYANLLLDNIKNVDLDLLKENLNNFSQVIRELSELES